MSISGRKRASKWDLKEDPQLFIGGLEYGTWPQKAGESVHNKESQPGSSDSEWYGIKSNNKDDRGYSDAMLAWHEDESYGTKMSPGLEDWRHRNSSRSPIISQGRSNRSQSRSPSYGSRKEPRLDGRSNAAKICGDVVAGRCRRGDHSPYLHQVDREYEDMRSRDDMERENSRCKNALFELSRECEPQSGGDIPCKFFMVGNCCKGKYCRFSHHGHTANRNDRSRDDSKRHSGNLDTLERHLRQSTSSVDAHDQRDEDRNGNIGAHEQRDADYTRDDRWVDSFNMEHRMFGHPIHNDEAVDCSKIERLQPIAETTAGMDGFESKGAENWFTDMEISSPWNSGLSSSHIVKEESGYISQTSQSLTINVPSLRTYEQSITREILGQEHQVTAATPPVISESAFLQSKPSSRENTGSSYSLEARKATNNWPMRSIDPKFPVNVLLGQSLDQNVHSSSAVTHPLSSFNVVGQNQQLSQFTNLSVLSQLLGSVQQLPHLSSVSNPQKLTEFVSTSISNSSRQVSPLPATSIHPNLVMAFDRQHDPLSDSTELVQHENDNQLPRLVPNPVEGKIVAGNDQYKTDNLVVELDQDCHQLDQPNPVANSNGEGRNGTKADDSQKPQANKPLEKMNGNGGVDEGKKKDVKGIRAFKFALAEFVKEILKPKWKEGQISKDSHKAIVKKVVDKVMGSIQGAHIPQSQEKIGSYLTSSKPKLTKLVEAYVEKHQKS